jgi:hypothetical protein
MTVTNRDGPCNTDPVLVYKHVFEGYPRWGTQRELFLGSSQKGLIDQMAETTNTTTTTSTRKPATRKPTARKSTARKSTTPRTRSTTRSAAAKSPSKPAAKRQRTIAKNKTREAAQAQTTAAKTTAAEGRNVAERAALVYVGATLEARDRVVGAATGLVDKFGTRAAAERQVSKDIRRFERRGNTARNQLERDVRKARTRLERVVRTRRRDAEQLIRRNRRSVEREVNGRTNLVTARLEDAAQAGLATGTKLANVAVERVAALV